MAKRVIVNQGAARRKMRKAKAVIETRAKKEFTYRGKTIAELQALPLAEVLPLLPSRTRRLYTRGVKVEELKFLRKVEEAKPGEVVRTHYRHMGILPRFVGKIIAVHNGKEFQNVTVQPEMIGHRLGEFAITTKACIHTGVGVGATRSSKHVPLEVILMATYYSTVSDTATTAQAYGRDMPCSPKSGRNVARAIKGMPVARAKTFLEEVMELKTAVPFKVRVRKIHHRKGGIGSGKYPVQTVKCMLKVLESAEANAEYKGLDKDRLVITHSTAYQGTVIQAFTPRAQGRATPHYNRLCNFEVILTQGEADEATAAEAKAAKKDSKKASKVKKAGEADKAKHEKIAKEHAKDKKEEA